MVYLVFGKMDTFCCHSCVTLCVYFATSSFDILPPLVLRNFSSALIVPSASCEAFIRLAICSWERLMDQSVTSMTVSARHLQAKCRGVSPFRFLAFGFACLDKSSSAISQYPFAAARWSAVSSLASSRSASTRAPSLSRTSAHSMWLFSAATCNAVEL